MRTDPFLTAVGRAKSEGIMFAKEQRTDIRTSVRFHGKAKEPIVRPAPAIDWNFLLAIDISNPLRHRYFLSGKHDGFPAYEIYMKTVEDGRPRLE